MTKTLLTDAEILSAFAKTNNGKKNFLAQFVPRDRLPRFLGSEAFELTANTKKEATRLAREYAARFIDMRVFEVINY
jgi:hypothetical protein